jgi:hypothetical protein
MKITDEREDVLTKNPTEWDRLMSALDTPPLLAPCSDVEIQELSSFHRLFSVPSFAIA